MENASHDIRADLEAVEAGRLDALSAEQVARLEAYLSTDARAAAQLAEQVPPAAPELQSAVASPSAGDWDRLWQRIEAASAPAQPTTKRPYVLRLWQPLAAAAAVCLLAFGVWTFVRPSPTPDWPVEWAHEVEINGLEVASGATPLVLAAGTDDTIPVIWVLDSGG